MIQKLMCVAAIAPLLLHGDFSFDQTSKVTGGAMAGMMKLAGAFSKQAREPIASTVLVKGNRMANVSRDHVNIIDLDAGTITDLDMKNKTYSSITFEQMKQAMQRMAARSGKPQDGGAQLNFTAAVKETGQTRTINGVNTQQKVLTLSASGTDQKTGNSGSMDMQMEMWLAPDVPGYGEVRDFYQRMAQKVDWTPAANMLGAMMAQNSQGLSELMKEMSKLEGVPMLQVTRIGATATGVPESETASQPPPPDVKEAAADSVLSRAGRLGGLAGGFGGFGRKKKQKEEPAPEPQAAPAAPQQTQTATASLFEITTELGNFSSAPVDASRLSVPAGFRQVEHPMEKH